MIECADALWSHLPHASIIREVAAAGQRMHLKGAIAVRSMRIDLRS